MRCSGHEVQRAALRHEVQWAEKWRYSTKGRMLWMEWRMSAGGSSATAGGDGAGVDKTTDDDKEPITFVVICFK